MTHNLTTHHEYIILIILKVCKSPSERFETISHQTDMNTETLLQQTTRFRDDLLKDLADMELAMYYLEAALSDYKEDGNTEALWTALYDVVAAQGGIGKLAERTKVNPEQLNDILVSKQEPRLDNLQNIFSGLGFQIRLEFAEN